MPPLHLLLPMPLDDGYDKEMIDGFRREERNRAERRWAAMEGAPRLKEMTEAQKRVLCSLWKRSETKATGSSVAEIARRTDLPEDEIEDILFDFRRDRLVTTNDITSLGDSDAVWVLTAPGSSRVVHLTNAVARYNRFRPDIDELDH